MHLRDLTTLEDCRMVVELEKHVWGYTDAEDVVPSPVLIVTIKRGGILLGAFDGDRMVGFAYSIPAVKDGRLTQWSHMLGVLDAYRSAGLGYGLKLMQRQRSMEQGIDLIEWTYDPLQAMNAHLNFTKLGVIVEEYEENIYGESSSPLHRGTPTDRFVAEWWIRAPHVERRLAPPAGVPVRPAAAGDAEPVNGTKRVGDWLECDRVDLSRSARRVLVEIPMRFGDMQAREPGLAQAWRLATREIFTTLFARGYRAVDFLLDRAGGKGQYVLAREALPVAANL